MGQAVRRGPGGVLGTGGDDAPTAMASGLVERRHAQTEGGPDPVGPTRLLLNKILAGGQVSDYPAATATGFSIGTPIRLPHSVHDPS
jgi:hypothetical protein